MTTTHEDDARPMQFYTIHTTAPYEVVSHLSTYIALAGHVAVVSEAPADAIVVMPSRHWGPLRWWCVIVALSGAPFLFHWLPELTPLHGFGIGWIVAAIVLLARRRHALSVPLTRESGEHDA